MREKFEKLPEIQAELENSDGELYWCDKQNQYRNNRVFQDSQTGWMNGAWYAFQEQQKKIARLQSALDELKTTCERHNDPMWRGFANDYDKGFSDCAASLLDGINRITGTDK